MKRNPEDVRELMDRFKMVIKDASIKMTHQRLEIFREIAETIEHPDVEAVFNGVRGRMPTVSLDTVYRTIRLFIDLGLVSTLRAPEGHLRVDANKKPHHHFVCSRCGLTRDFEVQQFDGLVIPEVVNELGKVETTYVEFRGVCRECQKGE